MWDYMRIMNTVQLYDLYGKAARLSLYWGKMLLADLWVSGGACAIVKVYPAKVGVTSWSKSSKMVEAFAILLSHLLTAHNWQNWKSTFRSCPIEFRGCRRSWSKNFQLYFKNDNFVNMWNLRQFPNKINFLLISGKLKFNFKSTLAHMSHNYNT